MHRVIEQGFTNPDAPDEDEIWRSEYWRSPSFLVNEGAIQSRWGQYVRRLKRRANARRHG